MTSMKRRSTAVPMAIVRGVMETGLETGRGVVAVDGVLETAAGVSGVASGEATGATTLVAPQSGQAGRLTGS
jgi:hypothetical protein